MSEFEVFYKLGLGHILDKNGYDHIIFVVALCALYELREWRKVLILVTAFTIGHSITLALSTLSVIFIDPDLIETLIPVTILLTAIFNLISNSERKSTNVRNYLFAGFFGLIHGLGFSNYLRSLLGTDEQIITQLFAFNVGLEVGQMVIVGILLLLSFLVVGLFGVSKRDWKMVISSAVAGVALILIIGA